jgi:hypothetical protein
MTRWFNTAGPCNPVEHYMLPAMERLPEVTLLVERGGYFVVHAPRQVGKTTALLSLAKSLTAEGRVLAVLVSMEVGAGHPRDVGAAELLQPPDFPDAHPGGRIAAALAAWAVASPRPLVVFLDEIDALRDDVLISVLRQLRDGYRNRPDRFPASLALIGLRDVRDYKVTTGEREHLGTASPFNIKVRSLTLRDFNAAEVAALYQQHTDETGQTFEPAAVARAFELTQGQPWLVNALAKLVVEELALDEHTPITLDHLERARQLLVERQETHLDSLAERLREPRIRAILEPMIAGRLLGDIPEDDRRFAIDLGLLRRGADGTLEVANPIYREIILRSLTSGTRDTLPPLTPSWLRGDGRLDFDQLRDAFLSFWRQHGEPLLASAPYHEIAPHLVLMAFLHRVVNGGGTIEREYAIGKGRMDLCIRRGPDMLAIELKVWRDKEADPVGDGLTQLEGCLAGLGLDTGWLVIFDRRTGAPPIASRTSVETATTPGGRAVTVIRG